MNFRYMSLAIRILLLPFLANGQCSNQVFPNNNLQRTGSTDYSEVILYLSISSCILTNKAYFIIQLPKGQIAGAVGGKQLLDVPDRDFAAGSLKPGYHPFWCSIGFMNDIRQISLSINWLLYSSCYIPYVDCTGNMDACNYPIFNALGGDNGQINSGLVPGTSQISCTFDKQRDMNC
jgi:hypothetical protein